MKVIIGVFLVLGPILASAVPNKIISEVCGFSYVEGVKFKRMNGRVARFCHDKKNLAPNYLTDINSMCTLGYVEGRKYFAIDGFHYKECLSLDSLGEVYAIDSNSFCANGYSTDEVILRGDQKFNFKYCVRNFDI